jgi:transposase
MPRIVSVPLSLEQRERLIFLAKHAKHWRERQRAQTILWLSEGKSVAEVATLQERIPETIRLQRRRWELYEFESIKEGHRSGRPNTLISDYQAKILDWVNTSPLNAEQIRVKLHEEYEVSVSVETIRKFLRDSDMVFKRTRHSLKKKEIRLHLNKQHSRLKNYESKRHVVKLY